MPYHIYNAATLVYDAPALRPRTRTYPRRTVLMLRGATLPYTRQHSDPIIILTPLFQFGCHYGLVGLLTLF